MAGVIPDEGEVHMLAIALGVVAPERIVLRLYTNDHTPQLDDLASDYDEMTGHGYAAKALDSGGWAFAPGTPGVNTPAKAEQPRQTFTFAAGAPVNVFGYYLVGEDSGRLWGAERSASAPHTVVNAGDAIEVTPTLRLRSEAP